MRSILQDFRHAARTLAKTPGLVVVAVVTLALAIGANTAIFSLINTALFAPLPFKDADKLVRVFRQSSDGSETRFFSYLDYMEYRDRSDVFDELTAHSNVPLSIETTDASETRFGQVVTGNFFAALGVEAVHGRVLTVEDDITPGAHPVVVISHSYWQRACGGRKGVVGETITLSGHAFTIVGIAPKGFTGTMPVPSPEMWAPLTMLAQIRPDMKNQLASRNNGFLFVVGRLKPGLAMEQAQARLAVTASQLLEIDPERYEDEYAVLVPSTGIIPMTPGMRGTVQGVSALLMAMVGLVLLVGCANVANLLLARSTTRRREIGTRLALGASKWRIIRQILAESVTLALLGGAAGLVLAIWTLDLLVLSLPELPWGITLNLDFGLDWRILSFALLASLLTGVVFGLAPALAAAKTELVTAMKDDSGARGQSPRKLSLQSLLIIGQVALSLVLLICAGLFMRSLMHAHSIDPGFDHKNVLAVALDFGARDFDEAATETFCDQLLQKTRALPGVESASIEDCPPLTLTLSSTGFWIEDRPITDPDDERVSTFKSTISIDNFRTLGMSLLRGREFTQGDAANAPGVAIVNQAFADRYWPGQNPLGKRISSKGADGPYMEVVGVARTVKHQFIGEDPRPYIYLPLSQHYDVQFATLLVRTEGDPMVAASPVREVIRDIDPSMSPMDIRSLTELISFSLIPAKFAAALFGMFGVIALLLASVGLYGVMSYSVSRRTHEIGIRVAIGAQKTDVLRLVLKRGVALTAIGFGIGLVISLASTRLFSSFLYGITSTDLLTFICVCMLLGAVAMLACYIPAHRATKVDPMVALRYE